MSGKVTLVSIALMMLLCTRTKCWADWQYTKWGMTVAQAQTASKGSLHLTKADQNPNSIPGLHLVEKLRGIYSAGGITFEAQLFFDAAGRLAYVGLELRDPRVNLEKLEASLAAKYGSPYKETNLLPGGYKKDWTGDGNDISLTVLDPGSTLPMLVMLKYGPLADTKGL
jgi:hypothetical protein